MKKINSMKYETVSCIYCEASASLLSQKITKLKIKDIKNDFETFKKNSKQKELKFQKIF